MANKLYVGNLNYATTEDALRSAFSAHGEVKSVTIISGKGFGFVEFESEQDAEKAKSALNGTELDGRTIRVDDARPREAPARTGAGGRGAGSHRERGRGRARERW